MTENTEKNGEADNEAPKKKKKSRRRKLLFWKKAPPLVPVLRLTGPIGAVSPLRQGMSLASVADTLEAAFTVKGARAVAILLNSPGGSPVQSALIYKRIRALAKENHVKVYVFAEDVAASGGYMIACAGDEIYADESSVIGSIGVISAGFGFTGLIEKLGIERRVHTAGESKAMLDPFQPERAEEVARLEALQREVHAHFKALVKESRGKRLAEEPELFTGAFWAGEKAKELGLIDGLGDLRSVMRHKFGKNVQLKKVGGARPWWRRAQGIGISPSRGEADLPQISAQISATWAEDLMAALEARSLWSRFGL